MINEGFTVATVIPGTCQGIISNNNSHSVLGAPGLNQV